MRVLIALGILGMISTTAPASSEPFPSICVQGSSVDFNGNQGPSVNLNDAVHDVEVVPGGFHAHAGYDRFCVT